MKTHMKMAFFGIATCTGLLGACNTGDTSDGLPGAWERRRDDGSLRDRYLFLADGSLTFDESKPDDRASEDHITGTYTATDDTVVALGTNAKDGARTQTTFTYYANARMFATQALRPTGANSGVVGEWAGTVKLEFPDEPTRPAEGATATYQFRADGTFTATGQRAGETTVEVRQGTYREETPGVFRVTPTGETVGQSFQIIDGAALVFPSRIFRRWLPE